MVDEERVEADFESFAKLTRLAWSRDLAHVEALIERLRVEVIMAPMQRGRKQLYRAAIDYFDDVLDERYEKAGLDREGSRQSAVAYLKRLLDGISDD